MKNTVKKLITIVNLAIAILLIAVLMMTALGVVETEALHNTVVRTLLYVLSAGFVLTGAVQLYYAFRNEEAIKSVMLRSGITESSSITRRVITDVVKRALMGERAVKVKSIKLYADSRGPYMTVIVDAETDDVPYTLEYVQRVVRTALRDVLSLTLNHIEVRLNKLSTTVTVDKSAILRDMSDLTAQESDNVAKEKVATVDTESESAEAPVYPDTEPTVDSEPTDTVTTEDSAPTCSETVSESPPPPTPQTLH